MNGLLEKLLQIDMIIFSQPYFKLINMANLLIIVTSLKSSNFGNNYQTTDMVQHIFEAINHNKYVR